MACPKKKQVLEDQGFGKFLKVGTYKRSGGGREAGRGGGKNYQYKFKRVQRKSDLKGRGGGGKRYQRGDTRGEIFIMLNEKNTSPARGRPTTLT